MNRTYLSSRARAVAGAVAKILRLEPWEWLYGVGAVAVCVGVAGFDSRVAWIVGGAFLVAPAVWIMLALGGENNGDSRERD